MKTASPHTKITAIKVTFFSCARVYSKSVIYDERIYNFFSFIFVQLFTENKYESDRCSVTRIHANARVKRSIQFHVDNDTAL